MKLSAYRTKSALHVVILLLLIIQVILSPTQSVQAQGFSLPAQINKSFNPIAIPAGGISTLSVSIFNPNSFALILASTNAWTDDLSVLNANLNFAVPANTTTTCGGIVSAVGTTLSLNGGTVPAQVGVTPGSCTVTVQVTSIISGNHVNTIPASILSATDPTGTIPVTNTTPASATLQVNTVQPPSLSKTFVPNTIWVGQTSVLTITLRNNDANTSLTQVSITDALPANVTVSSFAPTQCGGGTVTGTLNSISLSGGSIAASGTCNITVTVTSTTPGIYLNTIPASAIHTQQGVTNASAASAPLNVQSIGIIKSFSPTAFQSGGTSVLTITLQNPSSTAYTGVAFTDTLPAGLTIATPPNASTTCNNPPFTSLTAAAGTQTIALSGGLIPAGSILTPGTCTVIVTVTSSTAATYTNSIPAGALTTTQGASNILPATSNLTVYATGLGVTGSKNFNPATIALNGTSRLTINITAPADTQLTNFSISDALPAGVQVAAVPNPTKNGNCVGSTFTASPGDTLLTYNGGTIPQGATCALAVNVTAALPGIYTNTISPANVSDNQNRNLAGNFSANLTVSGLSVAKAFAPTAVNPNGISTLTITLTNTNTTQLDSVGLTETLPGTTTNGVVIAPTPNASTTCTGGSVTAAAGTQLITLSGGIIPAQVGAVPGICTIVLNVIGKGIAATYTNRVLVGNAVGTIHGSSPTIQVSNPAQATANLTIQPITIGIVKGFNPLTVFAGSASTLTIQLSNPNTVALMGIAFTDNLPQGTGGGMSIANPPNLNTGTCGGSISAIPGALSFSYSGGNLAASASCTLTLSVTMNVEANLTNTIGVGAVTSTNGASNTQAASASLTNLPGVSLTKVFGPNPIPAGVGNSSTITFTIENTGNVALTLLGFNDTLPAGMTATTFNAAQCGGTVSWSAVNNRITLANGALGAFATCTITVDVTAPVARNYLNCVPANGLTDAQGATNQTAACDTLTVIGPPTIIKAFSPNPTLAGGISALTFTLTNPAANPVPMTGVTFTDTFPIGLTLASIPNVAQCGGTVSSTPGSVTLTGGTLAVNGNCTVTVSVTAAAGGSYPNTSGAVSSTNGGTGNTASATLTVIEPPHISKAFAPSTVAIGEVSVLTFTLTNPLANTVALTGVAFNDTYPFGITNATPLTTTNTCGGALTAAAAGNTISLSGVSIPVSGSCTVSVQVIASSGGSFLNTSSTITSTNGGTGNTATDTLVVTGGGLSLLKSTSTVGYQAAGDTINYSYLLTNTGDVDLHPPYTVNDDTASGVICPAIPDPLIPGGTVTCTVAYTVLPADVTAKSVTNTASATALDGGGGTVTSNPSSVTVRLESLALTKTTSTASYRFAGNTITYNYTLTNTGSVTLYTPFNVADDHIGAPLGTPFSCGAVASLAPGANVTCTRNYTVTAADVTAGFVTNHATSTAMDAVSGGNTVTSNQGSVTVYAVVPPSIVKAFSPNSIAVGATSLLTFTITNPSPNAIPLTGVGFTDNFPAGVAVASAPAAAQCGGSVTSTATSVTLTGGTIIQGTSCTVTVSVTGLTSGVKVNTSGAVTSTNGGNGNTASATLTVTAPPTITKSFAPTTIVQGGTSLLTLTLTNPAGNSVAMTGVAFTDSLPAGVQVANPPASTSTCGGTFTPAASDTVLFFNGGTIAIAGTCTLTVNVTATSAGTFNNTTGTISSTEGGTGATSNTATLVATQSIDLSITKTDGKLAVNRGEALSYTITVSNAGPSPATGATVSDVIPASLTGATWTCAAGSGATCTASGSGNINDTVNIPANGTLTYTLLSTVSNTATNDVLNNATVIPPSGMTDTDLSNNSATDIDNLNRLSISKSANPTTYSALGAIINYSYTITNIGTSTLVSPFTITDDKLTPSCSAASSLAPSATITCTAAHAITQADLDAGSIVNNVHATGTDADGDTVTSNTATATVTGTQSPALTLVKSISSGSPYNAAGNVVNYSYALTNSGNVTLTGNGPLGVFTITDDKTTVTCPAGTTSLAPGAFVTCTSSYTVTQSDVDNGSVVNHAVGHGLFGATPVTSPQATQTAVGTQTPGLTLVKSITSGDPFNAAGNVVNYSYVMTNSGNVTLTGNGPLSVFTITDDKTTVTCPASPITLAPGASVTCTASYTITQADMDLGSVTNIAIGRALTLISGTRVNSNQDTKTATGTQTPALTLVKSITSGSPFNAAGNVLNYSYLLTNSGNVTLTGNGPLGVFTVTDDKTTVTCPSGTTSLAPAASVTCTASYTITQADMDLGSVTNHATGHSVFGATPVNSNQDTQTASGIQIHILSLAKTITSGSPFNAAGDIVNYNYLLTNSGNVTLTGTGPLGRFTITDDTTTVTCPASPTSLAPASTISCTASYTITQADMDLGSVTNHATGHSAFGATAVDSNQDTQTATGNQNPGLTLVKDITSGGTFDSAGDVVHYSYVLTNSGNVTLTGNDVSGRFTITDDHIGSPLGTAFTCDVATSLPPGGSVSCTSTYTFTQADLDDGTVTNLANGHGLFGPNPIDSNTASKTATGIQTPGLTLVKSITSGNPYSNTGDVLSYSYVLTNSGNVTLTGNGALGEFTITDDKATVTCPAPPTSLAPAATVTCTASYTIAAADLGNSVTNHATGHSLFKTTPVDSNTASQRAVGAPILNITKDDGLEIIAPEAQTEYTINLTNASLQDSTGIQLVDTIPTGTSFVSATGGGTFNSGPGTVTWPAFDLAAGASIQFKVRVKVDTAAQLAGPPAITSLTNTVTVQDDGTHSAGTPVRSQATDTDQIATAGVKTLTGTEQAGSADPNVLIGEIIDYSIRIDIPAGTINDLKAVDVLDHGLAFVGCDLTTPISAGSLILANNPCSDPTFLTVQGEPVTDTNPASVNAGRHITFEFGQVQNTSGTTQTLIVNYRVIALDIKDNANGVNGLKNGAEWIWEGGTLAGEAAGVNIIEPQLAITKTVDPSVAALGSVVTYTIHISHASSSTAPAYDALLTDGIPTGLILDETSIVVTGSAGLPLSTITSSPTQFSVYWSAFPLGEDATIKFKAKFIGGAPLINTANVEWSSIQIDPAPHLQPQSSFNQHSTERRYDPLDQAINDYITSASATLTQPSNPRTGFAPGEITLLPIQPADKSYQALGDLWLEIPRLGVKISIVGIPLGTDGDWDLTWLSNQAGYLNGTAYPTHAGNSVLTGHVYMADGTPGPFVNLHNLQYGDQIIVHLGGQSYIYEVREDKVISPKDNTTFKHEIYPWLTLITCKDYDAATNTYTHRVAVRAVLIKITSDVSSGGGR